MDKRYKIIELLARGLSHNLRYDTLADNILSITNSIKSNDNPFCNNCKDGWIYPVFLTPDEARIIRELVHSEGGKNWKKIRDGLISKVKQAIKGEL